MRFFFNLCKCVVVVVVVVWVCEKVSLKKTCYDDEVFTKSNFNPKEKKRKIDDVFLH